MKRKLLASIFQLFFVGTLFVSAQSSVSLEDVLSYSFHQNLVTSGDGKIAWVINKEGVRNIFYAQSPSYTPVQLTNFSEDDGQAISQLVFRGQDRLVFVRGGAPNRRGEYPNPTSNPEGANRSIYEVDLDSKNLEKIAEGSSPVVFGESTIFIKSGNCMIKKKDDDKPEKLFEIRGGVGSLRMSPDNSKLAFVSGRGDHAFIGVFQFSDSSLQILSPSVDIDSNPVWSADGNKIAFIRIPHQEFPLFTPVREALPFGIKVYDLEKGELTTDWTADEGQGSAFRSVSASNQLIWTGNDKIVFPWEKSGWTQLYELDPVTNSVRYLTPGNHEVQFVNQSADRSRILFSSNKDDIDRQHLWEYKNGRVTQITNGDGIEWLGVDDGVGSTFYIGSNSTTPASLFRLESGKSTLISGSDNYPSKSLVTLSQEIFTSADGMKINAQLFLPEDLKKGEQRPAVIFFHGGSRRQMLLGFHHRGYYHNAYAMNQYMASKGYVVLSVNYRSGIGYGMKFREAINYGANGASEFNDVLGAGLFLQNHPDVDDSKIGLWGGSYGGYLTALGLSRASDMFAAGVDIHGVTDWNVVIQNFVPSYNPLEDPEFAKLARDSSPISTMETWKSPVLLIHGDDDRNVPFSETVDKAELLRKNKVYFEQLVFPDEVHGFLLHKNWLDAYRATADFFDRMLRDK